MRTWKKAIVVTVGILLLASGGVIAHMGATGIVKERMDGMVAMKEAMATIGKMVRGINRTDFDRAEEAAQVLKSHGERLPKLFPDTEESRQKASEATALVWDDREDFNARNAAFLASVEQLKAVIAARDAEAFSTAFATTGKSCSACHELYRQKKQ